MVVLRNPLRTKPQWWGEMEDAAWWCVLRDEMNRLDPWGFFSSQEDLEVSLGPFTLAKTKIQKTRVFCCTVYTARKTHNIRGFWHEKCMREKTRISVLCFGKWCACATSLYLWPYTCSAHYVAGRGRVIPLKVTYHVTKNPNNTGEIGASVYIGKKPVKFRRSFKKSRCGGGFFDSGFLECLGEVAYGSNFQRKNRMWERFGFFYASVNGTIETVWQHWTGTKIVAISMQM